MSIRTFAAGVLVEKWDDEARTYWHAETGARAYTEAEADLRDLRRRPLLPGMMVDARGYATGDGTTDDTASLQAAIDAAGAGGVLEIPHGVYSVTAPVRPLPGQRIQGQGVIRRASGYSGFMVECADVAGVTLTAVTLDGGGGASPATWQSMVRLHRVTDWLIQGVTFRNAPFKNPALELRGAVRCRVDTNSFDLVGYGVILGLDYGETHPCHDNAITGNTMTAVDLNGVFVTENIGSAPGSVGWRVKRTTVSSNAISGCTDTAIEIGSGSDGATVAGNTIAACTTGILLRDTHFTTVTGNTVVSCGDGIADTGLNASSTGVVITGNQVWASGSRGIFLNTGTDRLVVSNVVASCGGPGISVTGGAGAIVGSNIVRDAGSHGIQIGTYNGGGPSQSVVTANIVADSGVTAGGVTDGILVVGPSDGMVLSGNRCYDSRTGAARTQRYGIHVLQASQVRLGADNHAQNNHGGQIQVSPGATV